MAEEQIVTRIVATSDFSNLIADLGKVSSALTTLQSKLNATNKNLSSQVAVMNRSFAETLRSTGQFSSHFVNLQSDVEKFGTQLDKGQIKLKQFFQVYQSHLKTNGGLIRQLATQQVQLQNAILQPLGKNAEGLMQYNVHIPAGLDKVKSRTALARQELQIMNRVIQEGANSLINWGKNTQWAGRQLTVGLTVPLAAFGAASAKAFREADQELTRLTKVYGGLAATSASDLGKIRKQVTDTASELSKAYGASFKETIALGADIAATGKQGNELLGSIKETTRLAVLGEVDRQDAMKATLAIQSAFKQNTDELAESINFLNAVENQTSTTLNDLVEAIPKAGPIIKGLGGSVEDLALYLTAMREGGINASEGANALKSGLASLINPTKVAKEMFAGFGISLTDIVQKNAGNTTETLLALQAALDSLNPLQKQQALEQLFGKFQFARMNALFENLGKQGSQTLQVMDLMKASSEDLANIAGRELSMVTESASGKYRRALEGLKADLAEVGEQFLTINTHLINIVSGILKFIDKLPGPIKTILAFFGGLTAVAGPLIMLTGVLANFFGYVIKGASHFRALFKGGEGWRLLTPEILAANKAGSLVEQTFYSDAKAAEILKTAVDRLSASYQKLAADANSARIVTNPGVSTVGGTQIIAAGGPRIVDPKHPLVGDMGTRAGAHHNPRSLMSINQRNATTIHGITPQAIPVNGGIGAVPQIFMNKDLPRIEGLTTSRGISTGIVAGEAAKWHALMGTLSMLSKREVADLQKEIARTGTFSTEISATFSQLLPHMTKITSNAAAQSAKIVAELQANKITLDAARAKIIALNTQIEAMMVQTTQQVAASLSRNAAVTQVPLLNQPIVNAKGKANIREIFRPERPVAKIIDKIARGLGVRTSGAGYSIETTKPKNFATGGRVFDGPRSDTTDTQFEYLPEGSFVLNRKASDNLLGFNKGGMVPAMVTPGEILIENPTSDELDMLEAYNNQFAVGGKVVKSQNNYGIPTTSLLKLLSANQMKKLVPGFSGSQRYYQAKGTAGVFIGDISDPKIIKKYSHLVNKNGVISRTTINSLGTNYKIPGDLFKAAIKARPKGVNLGSADNFLDTLAKNGIVDPKQAKNIKDAIEAKYFDYLSKNKVWDTNNEYWKVVNSILSKELVGNSNAKNLWKQYSSTVAVHTGSNTAKRGKSGASTSPQTIKIRDKDGKVINFGTLEGDLKQGYLFAHTKTPDPLRKMALQKLNMGGVVGGRVRRGKHNYGDIDYSRTPFGRGFGLTSTTPQIQTPPSEEVAMPKQRGMLTGNLIGLAGSMGGYSLGSKFGGQLGGFAGMMLLPVILDKAISKMGVLGKTSTGTASILGRLGPLLANPYVLAGAAIVGVTAGLMKLKKNAEETARINRLAFSGGVKPIKDFDSELKQVKKTIDDTRATAELLHAQMNSAGISGLTITIKQFSELREKVKSTHPELIKLFNDTPSDKLVKVAEGLKAQFVAAGNSAAEANAKIAALLAETGKTGFIQLVLGDEGLAKITNVKTAIDSMLNALSLLTSNEDRAGAILQIFSTMSDSIANAKDKGAALKEQFDAISKSGQANVKITEAQISVIAKTNQELALLLKSSNTIGEAIAKWRIALAGVQKDLNSLNNNELEQLAILSESILDQYNKLLDVSSKEAQNNAATGRLAKDIDSFNKKQEVASKVAIANIQAQIDLKNKQIDQIKKEGDARKRALRDQQQSEDIKLQIQQEQLNYQMALAAGDMSSAAQAQINIQRLVGAQQLRVAEDAIDKAVQSKIDALQAQIDALNKKGTAISNASSTAKPKQSPLTSTYEGILTTNKEYALGNITEQEAAQQLNNLIRQLEQSGGKKYLKDLGVPDGSINNLIREDGQTTRKDITKDMKGASLLFDSVNKGAESLISSQQLVVLKQILKAIETRGIDFDKDKTLGEKSYETSSGKVAAGQLNVSGAAKSYSEEKDLKSAMEKAIKSSNSGGTTGIASGLRKTYRLFSYKGVTYGYETSENKLYNFNTNSNTIGKEVTNLSSGGMIKNYDKGSIGGVKGPGSGTSDSIPAMLSNGEYVIKEKAVRKYGVPFFDNLNAQKFAMGGTASSKQKKVPSGKIMSQVESWKEANKQIVKIEIPPITANFATNSYELNKEQKLELQAIAKELVKSKLNSLVIQGHTDSVGKSKDNQVLSQNRAKSIAQYLSQLVPSTSFIPVGYGEYSPVVPNTNAANMAKNRRAEFILPDKYKTVYPEFNPKNHEAMLSGQKMEWSTGQMTASTIDWGKLFNKIKSGIGFNQGGAVSMPKYHNLNGPVPGPYGKEVSAILKAGTEGVYQEPYINALKNNQNGTMGNVFNFSATVNAAEGQDANQIADVVLRKFVKFTKDINTKQGPSKVIA